MTIETALDFVRECCGFSNAQISNKYSRQRKLHLDLNHPRLPVFHHANLQTVIKYATVWAKKRNVSFDLTYSQNGWGCICKGVDDWDEDLCEVIMRTLVSAERKSK